MSKRNKSVILVLILMATLIVSCFSYERSVSLKAAISARESVRDFSPIPLTTESKELINKLVEDVNYKSRLTIEFIEDNKDIVDSASFPRFSNVRSMLVMKGIKGDEDLKEKVGYYGEEIVLNLVSRDLGTCWIGGAFHRDLIEVPEGEELVCLILVGNTYNLVENKAITNRDRKPLSDRITIEKDEEEVDLESIGKMVSVREYPKWIDYGLEAVVEAPSAMNSQKPMVNYNAKDNTVTMSVEESDDDMNQFNLVDLGITKKHFEVGTGKGHFELGNGAQFILN